MRNWYLINQPSLTSGGFENEAFHDYRDDTINELLSSEIASTVILYNYDLSIQKTIRVIIQGNTPDTQLKSMERTVITCPGLLKAGMYVFFEDRYWLITGYPGNNGIYEKATIQLCQYMLRWQNDIGTIIDRWCCATSASKYDTGEVGGSNITLTSDSLTLLLPEDDETYYLDGKRVFIDGRKVNPVKVYNITRTDSVLYDYGESHGGILAFIAQKTEFNPEIDNQDLRICDYIKIKSSIKEDDVLDETDISFKIVYKGLNTITVGGNPKTFSIKYSNSSLLDLPVQWQITALPENENYIVYKLVDSSIEVSAKYNESIIGTKILLSATIKNHTENLYIDLGGGI